MKALLLTVTAYVLMASRAAAGDAPTESDGLAGKLHIVTTTIRSYRLLMMTRDDEGYVWAGAIHRVFHRYDPRTGAVRTIRLPYDATACACLAVGDKVYILGQTYPRLIIYDRKTEKFAKAEYPSKRPDVWYGAVAPDRRHLYLFDQGSTGVIK
jgi:sugar lactone lactonase YvrE